ncbi:MAG: hypothetical protein K0A89_08990 [ANME-2 cluster archaeon]|nr:hypothetical protein [ANME-2 cluster archaeon]
MCQDNTIRMHPGHSGMGMHHGQGGMGMHHGQGGMGMHHGQGGMSMHHGHSGMDMHQEQCGCGCHGGFSRHLKTKQEKIEQLGEYQQQLELELQAVKEHIEFLKGK